MHNAPAVTYPVGRSRFAGGLMCCAWLLGAFAATLWWMGGSPSAWAIAVECAALISCAAIAAWHWWNAPSGTLTWDGQAWRCSFDQSALTGKVLVSLDFQQCMLLRWSAGPGVHWLWLERRHRPQVWDDLRRAVYSRARMQAPRQAEPPAATS